MTLTLRRLVPALRSAGLNDEDIVSGRLAQTIVYLLERAGADLGYEYGWELFGPFSDGLAQALNETTRRTVMRLTDEAPEKVVAAAERVQELRERKPASMSDEQLWLRLVASVDFLERRSKVSLDNGSTPRYLENFAREAITAAQQAAVDTLPAADASVAA